MLETLARLGYASKAVIYILIGGLAAAAALNRGGRVTDRSGALRVILTQPHGRAILLVLAIGLCGYGLWRVLDAFFDPDGHGTSFGGLVTRIGNVAKAAIYGMLGIEAFRLTRGFGGSSGGGSMRLLAARMLDVPFGEWLLGLAGLIVVAYGASEIVSAAREKVGKRIDIGCLPPRARKPLINIGRFGVAARAVIIVVLGIFLVRAALQHDPSEAGGVRESMLELLRAFESRWVLATIALGLVAYGVYQAVHAYCRRIRSPI